MPDTGSPHSLPWPPSTGVTPDVPRDMEALAEQVAMRLGFVGSTAVATAETRSNNAYGLLTTPDRVQNVVVPASGLLQIAYSAEVKGSATINAFAAIFIGSNQLKYAEVDQAAPIVQAAEIFTASADQYTKVASGPRGLIARSTVDGSGTITQPQYTGDVTTGQAVFAASLDQQAVSGGFLVDDGGGFVLVDVAAGTYDISVQFKATSGSVTARNRKLWVRVLPF